MKAQSLLSLIMMSSLLTLVSCGGGSQSEAKLEISKAFVTDGLNLGGGGLLIHGAGPNNQIFTFALDKGTLEKTVKLDNGLWSFYAVGWDGATRFAGNTQCAMAKQDISTNATIDLTIKAENCNEAFKAEVAINELKTLTCGAFKTYNSIENKYYDLTVSTKDDFCSKLPMGLQSELPYYKIVALESKLGNFSPSTLESSCLISSPAGAVNASLIGHFPVTKFPMAIKAFRSEADCLTNSKHQVFHFPKGIHAGNPQDFDHLVFKAGTAPTQTRLILPSSITKRGTSLFGNILPQFLCGASGSYSDCFKEPVVDFHVFLRGYGDNHDHLLEKYTKMPESGAEFCSSISDNKKFSVNNCRVEDGNLYGQVKREDHLYCPNNNYTSITDLYSVGNLVYVLSRVWDNQLNQDVSKITTYNLDGEKVNEFSNGQIYEQLAVDQSGAIYASFGSVIYNLTTNMQYSAMGSISDIQISDSFLVASQWGGFLQTFSITGGFDLSYLTISGIKSIQVNGNEIFYITDSSTGIRKIQLNPSTGVIFGTSQLVFNAAEFIESFSIRQDGNIFAKTYTKIYETNATGSILNYYYKEHPSTNLVMLGSKIVVANQSDFLKVYELSGPTITMLSNPEHCEDTILIGNKNLKILSTQNTAHIDSFTQLVRNIGLRNIVNKEHPYYVFDTLQRDHEEVQEGGGHLSDIQSDFSSTGLFSLIRTHKTCEELATAAKVSPVKTQTVVNHYLEGKTFVVDFEITPSVSPLPFCLIAGPSCLSDIKVKASISLDNVVEERLVADLKCGAPVGRYEAFYFDKENEEDRELLLWNTQDMATAEFEYYSHHIEGQNEEYSEVVKAKKTAVDAFRVRHVNFHNSYSMGAQVTELESDGATILHKSMGAMADYPAPWSEVIGNITMNLEEANSCFPKGNTDLFASNINCTFSPQGDTQTSQGVDLKVDALINPNFLNTFSLQK